MSEIFNIITPYLPYAAPPVLGAFIGYLTNKVAIRMLFRPLKQWRLGRFKIPMTPGVIPSKRHDLAINIGEMVGEHLLTSEEINNSLKKEAFQDHLYSLIESKIGSFMKRDLGPLPALIPPAYKNYFDIGHKIILYQLKETVRDYLQSKDCEDSICKGINTWVDSLLKKQINSVIDYENRSGMYRFFHDQIDTITKDSSIEKWVRTSVSKKIVESVNRGDSVRDLLPETLSQMLAELIADQTPFVIQRTKDLLADPEIQQKITKAVRAGIEEFIESFGPMAAMIQNFLDMDMVEGKIKEYLEDENNDLISLIGEKEVAVKIETALRDRTYMVLEKPLHKLIEGVDKKNISLFSDQLSDQLLNIIKKPENVIVITEILHDNLEIKLAEGTKPIGEFAEEMFGAKGIEISREWLHSEIMTIVHSTATQKTVEEMIDNMVGKLLKKPIGRLSNIIPVGIREGLYRSMQSMSTKMLTSEVPGIVKSLNIRKIVTDRIDSFDLLRLERLLLSIMEEQFKYINLFGGLLGFLIGCINLIVIYCIR